MQNEWLRYSCQMNLPQFGIENQQKLQRAKVLIVGAGGLGCPAAQYLAASGIGTLGIADFDTVAIGNLHRQILYTPEEIGSKKALVACSKLQQQNPHIKLVPHELLVSSENVMQLINDYDIVVDCTDNFSTRYLLNDACVLQAKPVVYGAIYQYEGQVAVWNILNDDGTRSPNYRDIFPDVDALQVPGCAEGGVIPPLAGVIGCMQANEVLKYFTKSGELLAGKILMLDVQTMQSRIIKIGAATKTTITSLPASGQVLTISVTELQKAIEKEEVELVDVRTPEERMSFHIGGKHIPATEIENFPPPLQTDKSIVLYCASGKRSGEAVKRLSKKFPGGRFLSLEGGIKNWKEQA
jgi:sulfur-carrier protein adenylyltransferase/sulfurtransferase